MKCEYYDLCKNDMERKERRKRKVRKMDVAKIFPLILIVLDVGAGVVYACGGDIRKAVYWIAAAVLNVAVTF